MNVNRNSLIQNPPAVEAPKPTEGKLGNAKITLSPANPKTAEGFKTFFADSSKSITSRATQVVDSPKPTRAGGTQKEV